jgi:predicted dehydrogenase
MPRKSNRRQFLQTSAAASAGLMIAGSLKADESKSSNERIRFACIGVEGKGSSDSSDAGRNGDVVAICDVDEQRLDKAAKRFPDAKKYFDYRKMFDEMADSFDAVTVSTPDHSHAPAAVMAMKHGKHTFCQKPLTHSIFEARRMAEVARETGVATQMGNQGTAGSGLREAAAVIQAGTLGNVSEVHVWTNRPVWAQGGPRPAPSEVPPNLKWDLFLGPAPERPFAKGYHPFSWRGWWDFGTGALGDMACHTMNMPFMALDLRDPISVEAETAGHNKESYPKWSVINFEFPKTDAREAVKLVWYDGGKRPDKELLDGTNPPESGSLVIGEKGKLFSDGDYGAKFKLLGDLEKPEVEFKRSPGHFTEWVEAIKGGDPAMSNFADYSGGLTETVLLGNLAVWADGQRIEWDAKNLSSPNAPEVEEIVRYEYRKGWSL